MPPLAPKDMDFLIAGGVAAMVFLLVTLTDELMIANFVVKLGEKVNQK
jgi:hypothetical protein